MNPSKAIALCLTLGIALFSIYYLLQNIELYMSGFGLLLTIFAGFNVWLFLKLLLSRNQVNSG